MELNELPGADLILPGLEDLHQGKNDTIGSLLIAIASIRLTAAGLDIPQEPLVAEPELALYAHLQNERDDAYAYYTSHLIPHTHVFPPSSESGTYCFGTIQ